MSDFDKEMESFIQKVYESDICREYFRQKESIKQYPELKRQIDDFRQRNFQLQNDTDSNILFDEVDRFEREYEEFRRNPIVDEFLAAELAFCRLYQQISDKIAFAFAERFDMSGQEDDA
ncbi:MAG: YlbF family regulator [Lachnospiraceae bacterium]|nr:YlbF family regulator [Lachnospiraceae bacterium]